MKTATPTKFKETDIGVIPEEWAVKSLGDVLEITSSKRIFMSEYVDVGVPFYRGKEIIEKANGNRDISTPLFISEKRFSEITEKFGAPKEGDILMSSVGTLGVSYQVGKDEKFYFKDGNLTWFRNYGDGVCPEYIQYWLKSPAGQRSILSGAIGSTQPALTIDGLKKILLAIPTVGEQKQISEIVSSLDSKIELNRRINANLEKLAGSLFKKWFTDIGDDLPEGWRAGKLSELIGNISDRYIGNNEEDNFPYVPIDMISPKSLGLSLTAKSGDAKSSLIKFKKDDILFGAMRPYFHKVSLAPFDGLTRTTCFILRPKNKNTLAFCTLLIFQEETINFANSHSEGSTIPYAKWNNSLENMPIRIPPNEILSKFNDAVYPMLEMIRESFFENMNLITIRDSLLPRLMSGQIRVSNT